MPSSDMREEILSERNQGLALAFEIPRVSEIGLAQAEFTADPRECASCRRLTYDQRAAGRRAGLCFPRGAVPEANRKITWVIILQQFMQQGESNPGLYI